MRVPPPRHGYRAGGPIADWSSSVARLSRQRRDRYPCHARANRMAAHDDPAPGRTVAPVSGSDAVTSGFATICADWLWRRRARRSPVPGHVAIVRKYVLDRLTPEQIDQLRGIGDALLTRLDPEGRMTAVYDPDRTSRAAESTGVDLVASARSRDLAPVPGPESSSRRWSPERTSPALGLPSEFRWFPTEVVLQCGVPSSGCPRSAARPP